MVHAANPRAEIAVDGVAYAPHRMPDVKDLDVDYYAFSYYKVVHGLQTNDRSMDPTFRCYIPERRLRIISRVWHISCLIQDPEVR